MPKGEQFNTPKLDIPPQLMGQWVEKFVATVNEHEVEKIQSKAAMVIVESCVDLVKNIGLKKLASYQTILKEGASSMLIGAFFETLCSRVRGSKLQISKSLSTGQGGSAAGQLDAIARDTLKNTYAPFPEPFLLVTEFVESGDTLHDLLAAFKKIDPTINTKLDIAALVGPPEGLLEENEPLLSEFKMYAGTHETVALSAILAEIHNKPRRSGFRRAADPQKITVDALEGSEITTSWHTAFGQLANDILDFVNKK